MAVLDGALQDLNDLYFFAAVVEHGGFSSAGRALGIPKSRLSKRIAQLEDIATAAVFFASDDAGWVTGQTLMLAGGKRL